VRAAWLVAAVLATSGAGCATATPRDAPSPKVLMIFVDGLIPGALLAGDTPRIDALIERGAYSLAARAESTTISGSGYSTFLCGVHWDKHGVPDNAFAAPRYDRYPHVAKLLREARPDARTASAQMWEPIERLLVAPAAPDFDVFHEYDDYSDDYFDEASADSLCVRDLATVLRAEDVDLAVMMFGELDGVGHSEGNAHYFAEDPLYRRMLAKVDREVGALLDAIEARESADAEDWLVLLSSDHGGAKGSGHGQNVPAHRTIPLVVSGRGVARGEIFPPPQPVDLVPTALAHLGVSPRPEWDLDGVVLGRAPTRRPEPRLGENLIFHGDAELERGFDGVVGVPDASIAGWSDPGWMTVVAYGAQGGFPAPPDGRGGRGFFCGGARPAASSIEQTVDVARLWDAAGERGLAYELSGLLGGFEVRSDACRLLAVFLAGDVELGRAELAPPTPEERGGRTSFLFRRAEGPVPAGTERIVVRLEALAPGDLGGSGGRNDGYADDLALVLRVAR